MKPKILSWNVQGLGAKEKRVLVKRTIKDSKADIFLLQESKLQSVTNSDFRDFCGKNNWGWSFLPSVGASGGIIIRWDKSKFLVDDEFRGNFSLSVRITDLLTSFSWCCTAVYGPNLRNLRESFWTELEEVKEIWNLPWLIGGDFNIYRFSNEKLGGCRINTCMRRFSDFISNNSLIDLPLNGASFTWSNGQSRVSMSRIDRFLLCADWEDLKQLGLSLRVLRSLLKNGGFLLQLRAILVSSSGLNLSFSVEN